MQVHFENDGIVSKRNFCGIFDVCGFIFEKLQTSAVNF